MSDDVAAVLCLKGDGFRCDGFPPNSHNPPRSWHSDCLTAAGYKIVPDDDVAEDAVIGAYQKELTKDGYAVVKLPEGVTVAHGARLVRRWVWDNAFAIEDTP